MFHSRWIHKLLGLRGSRSLRRRRAAQTRKPVRLLLETLEERVVPSGGDPTVTQTANSYTQLTGLVAGDTAANTNYIIQITNSFAFNAGGQVTISALAAGSTMTIEGQGGTNYTLTGNGNRLFDVVGAGQTVTLKDLTLTGGSTVTSGGGILDAGGSVALSCATVKTNTATGSLAAFAKGGGVFVSGGGILSVKNSTIANNVAQGVAGTSASPNGGAAVGGGVFVTGASTVQITDSVV
ncbi:MAG: hypothetical protein ACRELF_15700, partial [Gemmataceae bacterium]